MNANRNCFNRDFEVRDFELAEENVKRWSEIFYKNKTRVTGHLKDPDLSENLPSVGRTFDLYIESLHCLLIAKKDLEIVKAKLQREAP